jgi:hypothetical protein
MKIAIIGGGWVGCHLAKKLISDHDVRIYDKNKNLFEGSSYKNQNRLHLGYHYARNHKTRELCKNTFQKFIEEYEFLISDVNTNLYCVPHKKSLIDYRTFIKIFDDYDHEEFKCDNLKVEGCLKTNEKHINFKKAKKYFNELLKDNFIQEEILTDDIVDLQNEYDLVINCTNNFIRNKTDEDSFYEVTISLLYEKINKTNFDALTLVDGTLFSIYPYEDNIYTVTDVEYTPMKRFNSVEGVKEYLSEIKNSDVLLRKQKIEDRILFFYPKFSQDFEYRDYFIAVKSKTPNDSDDRSPIITTEKNLINIFTGKIQGVYLIEEFVMNFINYGKTST